MEAPLAYFITFKVDVEENTVRFWQEIFDEQGKLVEIHEKVPIDLGHQKTGE